MGEQLMGRNETTQSQSVRAWFSHVVDQLTWEAGRHVRAFSRRLGLFSGLLLASAMLGTGAWWVEEEQIRQLTDIQSRLMAQKHHAPIQPVISHDADGRSRLKAFEDYLPAHEDIPNVVQDLLNLAENEHLSIQHGDYQAQVDQGGFLRYRMSLPVKGDAQAIYRFMQSALLAQKTLALESIQFKRERIESSEVEARIQWVVFTRLPVTPLSKSTAGTVATTIITPATASGERP